MTVVGLDVNVARAFLDGGVEQVVDELDDRRVARHAFEVGDVIDLRLDQFERVGRYILDDVVDDEDVGGVDVLCEDGLHVVRRRRDHLHGAAGHAGDFLDEEYVRRLAQRDCQNVVHLEERQDVVLFEEVAGDELDDLGVGKARCELRVRNVVGLGQRFEDLILRRHGEFDEDLAQQLPMIAAALFLDSLIDLLLGEDSLCQEYLADLLSGCRDRCLGHTVNSQCRKRRLLLPAQIVSVYYPKLLTADSSSSNISNRRESRVISMIFLHVSSRPQSFTSPSSSSHWF